MVNNDGSVLLDQYVRPSEKVTDYRTFVSGIEPAHLKEGAVSFSEAQQQVTKVLTGRTLVGHAVHHDLQVMPLLNGMSRIVTITICRVDLAAAV